MAPSASISDLQKKLWRAELYKDIMDNNYFAQSGMTGEGENNIVQILSDLKKSQGDTITVPFTAKLSGNGVVGDATLEGNEEEINPYSDAVSINQLRNGVALTGRYDEKRNVYDMYKDAKNKLSIWGQEVIERQIFMKLAGVTTLDLTDVNAATYSALATFSNSANVVPTADEAAGAGARYLCADSAGLDSLTAGDTLTVDLIRAAKMKAVLASPKIKPLKIKGKDFYVMFVHPWQAIDLKGTDTYNNMVKDAWWRGEDNPLFSGALAVIDGVILVEHEYVPTAGAGDAFGVGGTNVPASVRAFRSSLCGQQAVVIAQTDRTWTMDEDTFDYGNQRGVATGFIGGIQKLTFNSKDYGVINVDTGATIHS